MLTEILTKTTSIELLCEHASRLRDKEAFESTLYTCIAKYEASNVAVQVTNKAIQILGAAGCTKDFPIERYYKEAKICELIEGTSQIMEILISSNSIWRI